jgi:hypothetical protein
MSFNKIIKEELEVLNLLKEFNRIISEGFSDSDFGANDKISNNSVTIPKENTNIKSASAGVIDNYTTNLWCKNQTSVKFTLNNNIFYLEYCNMTNPKVSKGTTVSRGTILGTTTEDVKVNLYDSRGKSYYFKELNRVSTTPVSNNSSTSTADNTGLVKYDNRYSKFKYKSQTAGDAISGVTQDNRYKKFDW